MSYTIAYLGPRGTFTEAALWAFAGQAPLGTAEIEPLACSSPRQAIDAVRTGRADFAVVAIENSVDGPVTPTFDALAVAPGVQILAEVDLAIAFAIMHRPGQAVALCRRVATHTVAYQQVKGWLAENLPEHEFIAASSNAAAAEMVAQGKADLAAAPERAAELFGLEVAASGVADVAGARTRFALVGTSRKPAAPTGHDRTGIMFILENAPGSLAGALNEFALRGVDLTRIESRPIADGLGTYRFHVDLRGHIADEPLAEALRALYLRCEKLQYLGSWPEASRASDGEFDEISRRKEERMRRAAQWVTAAAEGELED